MPCPPPYGQKHRETTKLYRSTRNDPSIPGQEIKNIGKILIAIEPGRPGFTCLLRAGNRSASHLTAGILRFLT
jgi:hypothetical protein